jgi:hypothetical protein
MSTRNTRRGASTPGAQAPATPPMATARAASTGASLLFSPGDAVLTPTGTLASVCSHDPVARMYMVFVGDACLPFSDDTISAAPPGSRPPACPGDC